MSVHWHSSIRRCVNKNRRRKTMQKSLQFALAAGSMLIFASAAMAQDATVGFNPLFEVQPPIAFQVQPQIGQEYPLYSVLRILLANLRLALECNRRLDL